MFVIVKAYTDTLLYIMLQCSYFIYYVLNHRSRSRTPEVEVPEQPVVTSPRSLRFVFEYKNCKTYNKFEDLLQCSSWLISHFYRQSK